jgi:AraC-like DNA-binding protein
MGQTPAYIPFSTDFGSGYSVRRLRVDFCLWDTAEFEQDGLVHTKTVPFTIIAQPLHGHYEVGWGGRREVIGEGEVALVPASTEVTFVHHAGPSGVMRSRWVHLQATLLDLADLDAFLDLPIRADPKAVSVLDRQDLLVAPDETTLTGLATRAERAYQAAAWLCACGTPTQTWQTLVSSGARLLPALTYAQEHLAEALTVESLAQRAALSPSRFHAVFVEHLGVGPMAYVRRLRLAQACRLLVRDDVSIAEVGRRAGYANPFHFSRAFHRHCGMCPRDYRALHRDMVV